MDQLSGGLGSGALLCGRKPHRSSLNTLTVFGNSAHSPTPRSLHYPTTPVSVGLLQREEMIQVMISPKKVILKQMKSLMKKFKHQMEMIQTLKEMETTA
ncbi:hypothetical protein E2C01_045399 [Portunus trituberculatus]|uniref:Uncharacterized protein n=1 Tax=Portunus trituberculatus TaxID=210409 RepID=A0A5B7FY89_PORTR|nr:hypothetical protein [Portunus trituberculatus]